MHGRVFANESHERINAKDGCRQCIVPTPAIDWETGVAGHGHGLAKVRKGDRDCVVWHMAHGAALPFHFQSRGLKTMEVLARRVVATLGIKSTSG